MWVCSCRRRCARYSASGVLDTIDSACIGPSSLTISASSRSVILERAKTNRCHALALCSSSEDNSRIETRIPFDFLIEIPWGSGRTTQTPQYNPLEKLQVLILDNGNCVYKSHHILELIEAKYTNVPQLLSKNDVDCPRRSKSWSMASVMRWCLYSSSNRENCERSEEWMVR